MGIHGNHQLRVRAVQNLLPDPLTLAADDHRHPGKGRLTQILCPLAQSRHGNGDFRLGAGGFRFLPGGKHRLGAQNCSHAGPDNLVAVGVGAAFQKRHRNVQSVRRPQNGAQVSRILNAVQQQASRSRGIGLSLRQRAQEQCPLGGLHGRQGGHHIPGHPNQAHIFRNLRFHALGKNHCVKPRTVADGFSQEFGAVGGEKPRFLPGFPGVQQLSHLPQKRILPGGNRLLRHSFCTASKE